MSNQWKPSTDKEIDKLSFKEGDWNLAGSAITETRTRFAGQRVPSQRPLDEPSSSDESEYEYYTSDESTVSVEIENKVKPAASRYLMEVDSLKKILEDFSRCTVCGSAVNVSFQTICLATNIKLTCQKSDCPFVYHSPGPSETAIHQHDDDNYERSTDYAVNVLYVLGFLSCGDGGVEAARLLGLLGLPNDTTMETRSFKIIEDRIGIYIRGLADEILLENIEEEARLVVDDDGDYVQWKESVQKKVNQTTEVNGLELPTRKYPVINGSYDAAWQQKNSGHRYDSPSGHGLIFSQHTRKPLCYGVRSKLCGFCSSFKKKNPGATDEDITAHDCSKNWNGSSGAMEADIAVELLTTMNDKYNCTIGMLCCDDDSTLRADCQWNNDTYKEKHNTDELPMVPITRGPNKGKLQPRPDKGKLPGRVSEPGMVNDPNHRRKLWTGELIMLSRSKKEERLTMTKMDATRLGKNFGYMARTLKDVTPEQYVSVD